MLQTRNWACLEIYLLVLHEWHSIWNTLLYTRYIYIYIYMKVNFSHYRPGVAQRVGRGIALLFHDRGTRRGWVVSSTQRPHFTPGKDPVPIVQEVGWAPGPVWRGGKSRPYRDSIPDRCVYIYIHINPLNAELNPICHLLTLLGAHHILHVSGIRVNTKKCALVK